MKDKKIGITWKLIIYILFFLAAGVLLIYLFHVYFKNSFYSYIKENEIENVSYFVESKLKEADLENISDEITEDIGLVSHENNTCILVYDENGNVLLSYDILPFCMLHKMTHSDLKALYAQTEEQGGKDMFKMEVWGSAFRDAFWSHGAEEYFGIPGLEIRREDIPKDDKFKGATPAEKGMEVVMFSRIVDIDGKEYNIVLNSPSMPMGATEDILGIEAIYVCIILIAFSGVLALVMYKKISQPLALTNDKALLLAKGDYDVEFDMVGYKEIDQLNSTLNYAARELKKSEELRRELMANISHDLRTPLTMIRGCGEIMRDIPGECNAENIQIIIDESRRLNDMVTDILDLSKLQSGVVELDITEVAITKLIEDVVNGYKKTSENIEIEFKFDEYLHTKCDYIQISRVMHNLINNAINYSYEGGIVTVLQQKTDDGKIRIDVIDRGKGIAEEEIPLIWEKYYKVDKNRKMTSKGTGLGLSIVKNIFELHNIKYAVKSKKGEGSDFYFFMENIVSKKI